MRHGAAAFSQAGAYAGTFVVGPQDGRRGPTLPLIDPIDRDVGAGLLWKNPVRRNAGPRRFSLFRFARARARFALR
jgi:hypothetical protein